MSGNDYIKFMTEQFVTYLDRPREERKKRKLEQKVSYGVSNYWLGVLPFVLKSIRKKAE
ncbi:YqzE family protein [Oceanobacillus bengalensis]|uniref:YqzE family protein n=1 Tax=Oceanobacillus bengalensis TaxID=1435466 RepID=A0A494Z0N3_9BACI|nr:YqzE family protein [Oceanobacillus bengalensis]RKQ16024.1 YqzE family protein [Oceanobacillus bengalensis]